MDKYVVRNRVDGSVDVAASAQSYAVALAKWVEENEIPIADVEAAVDSVFDKAKDGKMPIPKIALIGYATMELSPNHKNLAAVQTRIDNFLKFSARFFPIKGKGGGIQRICKAGEEELHQGTAETGT